MMTHCAAIREAHKAVLADWAADIEDCGMNEDLVVRQTAMLASVHLDDPVTEEQVRHILRMAH